jgi:hypothetical protein
MALTMIKASSVIAGSIDGRAKAAGKGCLLSGEAAAGCKLQASSKSAALLQPVA